MSTSSCPSKPRGESSPSPLTQVLTSSTSLVYLFIISSFADVFCYERDLSDYKEMMFNKDHTNWVGTDSDCNPVVISVHTDRDKMTTQIILRDVRETKSENLKFDNNEDCLDVDSVLNLAKRVSPQLEIDNLKEIECEDIKVTQRNELNLKYFIFH